MLIINKKYSNLLKGYNRALELNQQLENEWNSKFKPELLSKLGKRELEQIRDYQSQMLAWEENEKLSTQQWEEIEKQEYADWESNEVSRQSIYLENKSQYVQSKIEKQKRERNNWMIAWISSSILSLCLVFLIFPLGKIKFILGLLGANCAIFMFFVALASFIVFVIKASSTVKGYPDYVPAPKPQSAWMNTTSRPIAPNMTQDLIDKYSCPNIISQWMEEIQYKDLGKEYFRKLTKENPKAIGGIPGEIAMLNEHIWCERIDFEGIYILGLKTSTLGDIDGISITRKGLWVLESKYLTGNVVYKNGHWKQSVFVKHPRQSFIDGWEEKEFTEPFQPDVQLEKAIEKITQLFSDFSKENPWMTTAINGSIVFSHENVDLNISNCGFLYAELNEYFSLIYKGHDLKEMTFEKQLEITDILLTANRKFEKEEVSAVKLAEDIYNQSIKSLEKLIKSPAVN